MAQVVRQRLLLRQLAPHLPSSPGRVVDLGAGSGRLAIALVRQGHRVTAVDADPAVVTRLRRRRDRLEPGDAARLRVVSGRVETAVGHLGAEDFDVVCCHAVLPLVADHRAVLAVMARLARPGGVVSVVAKNAAPLEGSPPERTPDGQVLAAHHVADVMATLASVGIDVVAWFGVPIATPPRHRPVTAGVVDAQVAHTERLGRHDLARHEARQFHVIGIRPAPRP